MELFGLTLVPVDTEISFARLSSTQQKSIKNKKNPYVTQPNSMKVQLKTKMLELLFGLKAFEVIFDVVLNLFLVFDSRIFTQELSIQ